jgi:hypothetical protein
MTVKGQEFPAYDARGIQGMGLAYATSNRGACHLRGYTVASEVLGIPVKTDPLVTEGKPELVKAFQDATAAFDSAGICIFTTFAWGLADVQPQVAAACGGEFTLENLAKIGERIWNMERDFNNRAGFTAKDDNLPPRLLNEPPRPARPRAWSASCPRCCRSTTPPAAGTPTASSRPTRASAWACSPRPLISRQRKAVPGRLARFGTRSPLDKDSNETRDPGRRPGRRHRRRDPAQARAERHHRPGGRRAEAPYSRMAIPYLLMGNIGEEGTTCATAPGTSRQLRHRAEARRANAVDTAGAHRPLDDGSVLPFDRLLIATGSSPASPPIPGIHCPACTRAGR